jgi:predicted transcriptional regulator
MTRGDRFEAAYNKIDALLRKKFSLVKGASFSAIVSYAAKSDAAVRAYKDDLLEHGELRNAIVHDRGTNSVLLADPREEAVLRIEEIWGRLSKPRTLRTLAPAPIRVFSTGECLLEALSYMRSNDFSQIVVLSEEKHVILSAEGIAHWLEAKFTEDIIELSAVNIHDVLGFEPNDTCVYLKIDETVERAREVFTTDIGKRVFSALVTENGKPSQKPVNIVTPWNIVAGALR